MKQPASNDDLLRDCRLLFGAAPRLSANFLAYIQLSGVNAAFRQLARETHPDTRQSREPGLQQPSTVDKFIAMRQAVENLRHFINCRDSSAAGRGSTSLPDDRPFSPPGNGAAATGTRKCRRGSGAVFSPGGLAPGRFDWLLYQGDMPVRQLLLGHFLYYAGLVPWGLVVRALVWQRSGRPRLGELARSHGWMTDEHVRMVLNNINRAKPFGQTAVDLALISAAERRFLLHDQRQLQQKIGRFFVESKLLTPERFAKVIVRFHQHNAGVNKRSG